MRIPAADRTRFQLAYFLTANGKPLTDVPIFAVDGARREQIVLGSDGRARPPALDFFRSKTAYVDAPPVPGRRVSFDLLATAQPARDLDAEEMVATLAQTNAGIRKAAGPIGLVAPKMARIVFVGGGSGEAVAADGRRTSLPTANGAPYFQPANMPGARRIVLARVPVRLAIVPAVKKKG